MPINILMPALSPTMTEGTLATWHKQEGDAVEAGELLAEIETDKATMEVEAVDEGILGKILVPGNTHNVKVNAVIAVLLEEGESMEDVDLDALMAAAAPEQPAPEAEEIPAEASAPTPEPAPAAAPVVTPAPEGRIFASPLARRMAEQNNIPLHTLQGSGPKGRIIKQDILAAQEQGLVGTSCAGLGGLNLQPLSGPLFQDVPLTPMRQVIAQRLTESKQTIPHFYLEVDCCIDALLDARRHLNKSLEAQGKKLTVNDFVVWASALALRDNPEANASWMGDKIRQFKQADIAVAVAIEGGLITPIVRGADAKSLVQISDEIKSLVKRAHGGQLAPEEYQGGGFSISNLGMYGIKSFQAIVNPPQACILAVGAGEERAVVKDGGLAKATVMTCTLSVDHRVVDGAVAANMLGSLKTYLENPWAMLGRVMAGA